MTYQIRRLDPDDWRDLRDVRLAAHAEDGRRLTLWVTDGNDRARAFYQRAGFRSTGRRQPVRPHEPALWEEEMELWLGDQFRG